MTSRNNPTDWSLETIFRSNTGTGVGPFALDVGNCVRCWRRGRTASSRRLFAFSRDVREGSFVVWANGQSVDTPVRGTGVIPSNLVILRLSTVSDLRHRA